LGTCSPVSQWSVAKWPRQSNSHQINNNKKWWTKKKWLSKTSLSVSVCPPSSIPFPPIDEKRLAQHPWPSFFFFSRRLPALFSCSRSFCALLLPDCVLPCQELEDILASYSSQAKRATLYQYWKGGTISLYVHELLASSVSPGLCKGKGTAKNRERAWSQAQEHVEWCYFFCEGLNLQPNCRRQKEVKDEGCSGKVKGSHHHYDYWIRGQSLLCIMSFFDLSYTTTIVFLRLLSFSGYYFWLCFLATTHSSSSIIIITAVVLLLVICCWHSFDHHNNGHHTTTMLK